MGEDNTIDGVESTFAYIYTYITTQAKKKHQYKPNQIEIPKNHVSRIPACRSLCCGVNVFATYSSSGVGTRAGLPNGVTKLWVGGSC
jgi:hypothetical protein